jgi:hypothetical protein
MAARIPLILSQPARRDAAAIDLIENIVAAAMLVPGLDANLIGDIETFEFGGTDHLCLQGHTRDIVLASFLDLPTAETAWNRLGQSGHFVDFSSSAESIRTSHSAGMRRVFYFQLSPRQQVAALLDRCRELLAAQQLSLVTIGIAPAASLPGSPTQRGSAVLPIVSNANRTAQIPDQPAPQSYTSSLRTAESVRTADRAPIETREVVRPNAIQEESEDWSQLDKLVDDLDAMDL